MSKIIPTCPGDLKDECVEHIIAGKIYSRIVMVVFSPFRDGENISAKRGEECSIMRIEISSMSVKISETWSRDVLDLEESLLSCYSDESAVFER